MPSIALTVGGSPYIEGDDTAPLARERHRVYHVDLGRKA